MFERLPHPLPLSNSFRSTFLRWYLRHFRRRCSPRKLGLALIELAKILQKRDTKSVTVLPPLSSSSSKPSLFQFHEDHDMFRPSTPVTMDPKDWIVSNSATSSNQSETKHTPVEIEMETESFECLEQDLKNTSSSIRPPSCQNKRDANWLRECLEHSPVKQDRNDEEQDPVWKCFRDNLKTGVEMGPSGVSSDKGGLTKSDISLILYERTWSRLLHSNKSPPDTVPSLLTLEPVPEQEMEREDRHQEEEEETNEQNETVIKPTTIWSCRCGRRFRAFYESTCSSKSSDTITNSLR